MSTLRPGTLVRVTERALKFDGMERDGNLWIVEDDKEDPPSIGISAKSLATGTQWIWWSHEYEEARDGEG